MGRRRAEQAEEEKTLPLQPEIRDSLYCECLDDLDRLRNYWTVFFSNNVSLTKSIFDKVGGFDDSFRGWGIEDNEIGYRLQKAGCRFVLNRKAIGFHIGTEGEILNPYLSPDEKKFKALAENMARFYDKFPDRAVKRFIIGLNVKVPEEYRFFKDDQDTHAVSLGGVCNNACTVCSRLEKKRPYRATEDIEDELGSFANRKSVWFGGSEPTIRQDFFDLVSHAKYVGFREIGLLTNCRMFSYMDFAKKAVSSGVTRFEIQLCGHTPELHDSITRVPGSFLQTLQGVRNLKALGAHITLDIVLCEENISRSGDMQRFAHSLQPDSVKTTAAGELRKAVSGPGS